MRYSSEPEPAHSGRRKRLQCRFETIASFREEYRRNIANGGAFFASEDAFAARELVDVVLELVWCKQSVQLEGEVVRRVPGGLREAGALPGVAVQFLEMEAPLRERLAQLAELPPLPEPQQSDHRNAQRRPTQVAGRVETIAGELAGRTTNLSHSGVLMAVDGEPLPAGTAVRVTLKHPTSGESRELAGEVVRAVSADGRETELAIRFAGSDGASEFEFIESVQSADHVRRLGAIGGPIGTLGLANLLQMFSSCAERGVLVLQRGAQRATVAFESGTLVHARLERVSGVKALARLFSWTDGFFEFNEVCEEPATESASIPIYGAVMEAMTQLDELARLDVAGLPRDGVLELDLAVMLDSDGELDKLERTLVSRISEAAVRIGALLDGLPDFDADIYRSLLALEERGVVRVRS